MISKFLEIRSVLRSILNHPLNKSRKSSALLRFIRWQVSSRLLPGSVVYPWLNDVKFFVTLGEQGITQNIYCGLQEFEDMAYVLHVVEENDVFIDVGTNVGSYTLLACGVQGAQGVCFEPIPSTYKKLLENLRLNDLQARVNAYCIGIADHEGELFFTADQGSMNHLVYEDNGVQNLTKVGVVPLDTALKDITPTIIKIDVEGFETLVIQGAADTLKQTSLHSLIVEMNGNGNLMGFNEDELVKEIESFGFAPCSYDPFNRVLIQINGKNLKSNNTLFCRISHLNNIRTRAMKASPIQVLGYSI